MSRCHRGIVIAVVGAVLLPLVGSPLVAATPTEFAGTPRGQTTAESKAPAATTSLPPPVGAPAPVTRTGRAGQPVDERATRIAVAPDGDARWRIELRTRLSTADEREQYRAFQREFRNDTATYLDPFAARIRRTVGEAGNQTGRTMTATNFTATTTVQDTQWGIVAFSFTWSNFARQKDATLVVGDAFEGGYSLGPNATLTIVAPAGYTVGTAAPPPDGNESGVLRWTGPRDFADGRPRVVLVPARTPSPTGGPSEGSGLPLVPVALAGAGVVVVLAVVAIRSNILSGRAGRGPSDDETQ